MMPRASVECRRPNSCIPEMITMIQILHGTVHGKTIQLDEEPGVQDGQKVELSVRVVGSPVATATWGEGLKRCAGALADLPGLDDDLEEILRARKTAKIREVPE